MGLVLASLAGCSDHEATSPPKDSGISDASAEDSSVASQRPDTGTPALDAAVRECEKPRTALPASVLPRCTATTYDCILGCANAPDMDACRGACVKADTMPPASQFPLHCEACIYLHLFACADQNGCHPQTASTFCCLADRCPEGSPEGCADQRCANEINSTLQCVYDKHPDCLDFTKELIVQCFDTTPVDHDDAGTDDAGR